ncbi:hypothetical protein V6N13_041171 [Hibiscus sabdariffa]|uniref:Uncharacterized protein n=1 Tax=Hibiscus sabdariffa TaxID=183260 RepID=A0ABR2RAK8_9ROSI
MHHIKLRKCSIYFFSSILPSHGKIISLYYQAVPPHSDICKEPPRSSLPKLIFAEWLPEHKPVASQVDLIAVQVRTSGTLSWIHIHLVVIFKMN